MIYDTLAHRAQYESTHPGLTAALEFLATADLAALPDGRTELDGDRLFVNVMSYTTKAENPTPENHKKYMDVFFLLEGEELVKVAPLEEMGPLVKALPEEDAWLHEGDGVPLPLGHNRFLAIFPGDAHAPSIAPNAPAHARKCVVKVQL